MNARNLLILIGTIFTAIITFLAYEVYVNVDTETDKAKFVAQSNTVFDKADELSSGIYKERLLGIVAIGGKNVEDFKKQTAENDKLYTDIYNTLTTQEEYVESSMAQVAINQLETAYKAHKTARTMAVSKDINVTDWLDYISQISTNLAQVKFAMFTPQDDINKGIFANLVIKPIISEISDLTNSEQAFILDLLANNAELGDETKGKITKIREKYLAKLQALTQISNSQLVTEDVKVKIKAMNESLTQMEETKRALYTTLLFGFGEKPTTEDFLGMSNSMDKRINDVAVAISEPTAQEINAVVEKDTSKKTFMIFAMITLAIFLVAIAILMQVRILLPLAKQKILREDFEGSVKGLIDNVKAHIANVSVSAESIQSSSSTVRSNVSNVENEANNTDTNVQAVASAIHQLNASVVEINNNMENVNNMIQTATSSSNETKHLMDRLSEGSDRIGDVVNIISGIADQTNLLALNASIEAARAGEAGRGFSVVADEVRKLAEETANATMKIQGFVQEIQSQSKVAQKSIDEFSVQMERINDISANVQTSIAEQSEAAESIAENATGASESTNRVRDSISEIVSLIDTNDTTCNEMASTVNTSVQEVQELSETSDKFLEEIKKI